MTISVVIPAHNEEKYLGTCLENILAHRSPNVIEVIVVDNASKDKTVQVAGSRPGVTVLHEARKGAQYARERGFRASRGELVACIDADVLVPEGWFEKAEQAFAEDPEVVGVTGPYHYHDLPPFSRYCTNAVCDMSGLVHSVTGAQLWGGNCVIRRAALERIGGFDTTIAFYGDDVNTGRRLSDVGTVLHLPALTVSSSARRLKGQGMMKTGIAYIMNSLSELILHRPATKEYRDIR
ncbi:MAG: glycosyltransferase family A protein [Candidatus Peribacteraceae bacterium]|jgi:glycosyltransferase involved in cell wall biosynthesis